MTRPVLPDEQPGAGLDPEFVQAVRELTEQMVSFNRLLGIQLERLSADGVSGWLAMRADLVGHFVQQRIHGGAISASLDAIGAAAVMAALGERYKLEPLPQRLLRFAKIGTIDLRVDYLRPGIGARFGLKAEVLRLGSRVATCRMEFLGEDDSLVAVGMAAYIVS